MSSGLCPATNYALWCMLEETPALSLPLCSSSIRDPFDLINTLPLTAVKLGRWKRLLERSRHCPVHFCGLKLSSAGKTLEAQPAAGSLCGRLAQRHSSSFFPCCSFPQSLSGVQLLTSKGGVKGAGLLGCLDRLRLGPTENAAACCSHSIYWPTAIIALLPKQLGWWSKVHCQ